MSFLMVFIVLLSSVSMGIAYFKKIKSLNVKMNAFFLIGTFVWIILNYIGFDFHPKLKIGFSLCIIIVVLYNTFAIINSRNISIIIGVSVIFIVGIYSIFFSPFIKDTTIENNDYVCTYSKISGIDETYVYYYKKYGIFINTKPKMVANYGFYRGNLVDILNREPYEMYYYD